MTIDVATGIARILKQEGVGWVSTFPVCRVNNALGREGVRPPQIGSHLHHERLRQSDADGAEAGVEQARPGPATRRDVAGSAADAIVGGDVHRNASR